MKKFIMGNAAIAAGAAEAGVNVVTGYPGTPATEIVEDLAGKKGIYTQWSTNELVALEVALGASLAGARSLAVMKHNGTNVATDFMMHLAFTGVRAGMVMISADDPGANSSQNEEDTRILCHTYGHLPMFDPSNPTEAKEMIKEAFILSEQTLSCYILRPVMRICHARSVIEMDENAAPHEFKSDFVNDRTRYVMSAVSEKAAGGRNRPLWRHELLNKKQEEYTDIAENSRFNWSEEGDSEIGLIGCGLGYSYIKEAEQMLDRKFPILKLGTLPLPTKKVLAFLKTVKNVVIFEEIEPVVERLIKQLCFEQGVNVQVYGREGFIPSEGELSAHIVIEAVNKLEAKDCGNCKGSKAVEASSQISAPIRTRTQCVGCSYRGLLNALKETIMIKHKGMVTGDIGCHDAGSFVPIEVQSTIYCMGASIPMAAGIKAAGYDKPVVALIGDSTFFHLGFNGLVSSVYNKANITVVLAENGTTAMTGFQPHANSGEYLTHEVAPRIRPQALVESLGIKPHKCNPYDIASVKTALEAAILEPGVSVVLSQAPCLLRLSKSDKLPYTPRKVSIDAERCNGCKICINNFGCPALHYENDKVTLDELTCVECGMCADVCKRGAIK